MNATATVTELHPSASLASATITRDHLHRALRAVSLFICPDETRFHLATIHVEITDGAIHLVATDGHTLAHARPVATHVTGEGSALIAAPDVKDLIAALKPSKTNAHNEVQIALVGAGKISVTCQDIAFVRTGVDSQYPPWRAVVPERATDSSKGAGLFGVNPAYLARAGKAAECLCTDKRSPAGFEFTAPMNALDPMRLDYHDRESGSIVVVIMPMRV